VQHAAGLSQTDGVIERGGSHAQDTRATGRHRLGYRRGGRIFTVGTAGAATTVPFASGTDWTAFTADPGSTPFLQTPNALGAAQLVCRSAVAHHRAHPGRRSTTPRSTDGPLTSRQSLGRIGYGAPGSMGRRLRPISLTTSSRRRSSWTAHRPAGPSTSPSMITHRFE
jgi:hypothetical protein